METSDKSADGIAAELGFIYVELNLTIGSEKDKGVIASPYRASLKDANGFTYSLFSKGKEPQLKESYDDIPNSSSVQGWVEFQVHTNATGISLIYDEYATTMHLDLPLSLKLPVSNSTPVATGSSLHFAPFVSPATGFSVSMPGTPDESYQR